MTQQKTVQKEKPEKSEESPEEAEVQPVEEETIKVKVKTDKTPVTPVHIKLTYERGNALRQLLTVLTNMSFDDATFNFNGNLSLIQMNPSRTAMVKAVVDMGLGLSTLSKPPETIRTFTCQVAALKRALKDSDATIDVTQNELIVVSEHYGKTIKTTLPLLEDTIEEYPEPDVTLNISAELDLSEIFNALTRLANPPEGLQFISKKGHLTVKGKGDCQSIEISGLKCEGKNGKATYSLDLLKSLGKKTWNVEFAADLPMKASKTETKYDYQSGKTLERRAVSTLVVWLAPRIEVD